MSVTSSPIHDVTEEDAEEVGAVLTLAFCDDPLTRFMYPSAAQRVASFPAIVRAFAQAALDHGTGRTIEGTGVALWLPPPLHPDDEALAALVDEAPSDVRDDMGALFAAMDEYHPPGEYWYLPLIGVEPAARGAGRGSALLREGLERADAEHAPVYLDSTNPRNVPLYQRHGFEVLETLTVGSAPPVWPMLRPAR